jgi:hypothetical protein
MHGSSPTPRLPITTWVAELAIPVWLQLGYDLLAVPLELFDP